MYHSVTTCNNYEKHQKDSKRRKGKGCNNMSNTPTKEKVIVINTDEGKFECEVRQIPLSDLKLDPSNPRMVEVGITTETIDAYDEAFVAKAMKEIADWKELKQSILATGGLQDPPFVKKDSDAKYSVREGNRRTCTLRDIVNSIQKKEKGYEKYILEDYSMPQCIIYPPEMSERAIALHLGQMHVVGKTPYGAFQKASMCQKMVNLGISQNQVATTIGLSKTYIGQYLWAREMLLEYQKKYPDDRNWTTKFSHFQKIYSKKWLKEKWWINPQNQDEFMAWVYHGKIPHAFRIAGKVGLRQVIEDQTAYKSLQKEGNNLNDVIDDLKRKKNRTDTLDEMQDDILKSISFLHENLGHLTQSKMDEIRGDEETKTIIAETAEHFAEINKKLSNKG